MFKRICFLNLLLLMFCTAWLQADCYSCNPYTMHFDLLVWKAWEKSLVLTNKTSPLFTTDNFTKTKVFHPDFDWNCGYRIGIGYYPNCYPLEATFDWTYYQTTISQHRSTNSNDLTNVNNQEGMFPILAVASDIISGDYVSEASLRGKLTLNVVDLGLGCPFKWTERFELKPWIGFRGAWIRQHANVRYRGGIFLTSILEGGVSLNGTDHIHIKNNFWGIGPRIGLEPQYTLGCGFSFYANGAISGVLGEISVNQKERYLDDERFSRRKDQFRFRWIADLGAGISWKRCLCQDQNLLTIRLGWEYHIFFHQFEIKGDAFRLVSRNRNLNIQGVTLSAQIDF